MVGRRTTIALTVLALSAGSLAQGSADAKPWPRGGKARLVRAVPREVLVRYRPGVHRSDRLAVRRSAGLRLKERLPLPRLELVRTRRGVSVGQAVADLERRGKVAYAEPNFLYHLDAVPNDLRFPEQWGLPKIDAPEAWDVETGHHEVVAAVLDTGLEYEHLDLKTNRWVNPGESGGLEVNDVDDDNNGYVDDHMGWDFVGDDNDPRDAHGHGTHVAGILGAQGNNTEGGTGVAWDVAVMPLRVCSAGGSCDLASVTAAITYAGEMEADVANMSFSGGAFSQAQKDAIDNAPGTLFVASAGNAGRSNDVTPQYPCSHTSSNLICVAASTQTDDRWGNSNYGATSVDLAAPGEDVLSTFPAFDTVFADDFETTANWNFVEESSPDPLKWERTTEAAVSPTRSITDSHGGDYAKDADVAVAKSTPIDLGSRTGCSLRYHLRIQTQAGADWLRVEAAHGTGTFEELDAWSGNSGGAFVLLTSDLGDFDGDTQTNLRFRLEANGDTTVGDGAHVDDVLVRCLKPVASYEPSDGYAELDGTSMAAPHVAGAAAVLQAANPAATPTELKDAVLGTVDPVSAFSGITVTGGRLNLDRALAFATDTTPPTAFDLSAPADGATVTTATPSLSWGPSNDPESGVTYRLFIDGALNREVAGTSTTPAGPLGEGSHTWFVEAVNGVGLATATSPRTFTVDLSATHVRKVTLKLRKHLRARGKVTVADGFTPCLQDAEVKLQRKRDGEWRTVRTASAAPSGSFNSRLRDRPGRYRASLVQTQSGNDVCGAAVSRRVRHRH